MTSSSRPQHVHQHAEDESEARQRWLTSAWSFISTVLPPAPARLLEIGCGPAGGIVPAALDAGYQAVGVDPQAPVGAAYRNMPFEAYEPQVAVDAVVAVQALHHLADLDAAFEQVDRTLSRDGLVVIVEWAWERIDEATARWAFDRAPGGAGSGWADALRTDWQASGLLWPEFRDRWAQDHGLHPWRAVESALVRRFDPVLRVEGPSLFGDIPEITEETERAAIAAGRIVATGVHWVGRLRAGTDTP